jgi:nitrite reductase/ring-hydroxylating ferredoxin subunit
MAEFHKVARVGDLAPGEVNVYEVEGHRVALCNVGGEFYAIEDVCTHDGGSLDQGELDGVEIECPRHGARFDVRTGEATLMPAVMPVQTYPVRIEGEMIFVGTTPQAEPQAEG